MTRYSKKEVEDRGYRNFVIVRLTICKLCGELSKSRNQNRICAWKNTHMRTCSGKYIADQMKDTNKKVKKS